MAPDKNDCIMRIEELGKSYGRVRAVDGISFDVRRGELFGFLGPNGAGKTTTVKLLTGLAKPDSGTASIDGRDMFIYGEQTRRDIGVVHQHVSLDLDLTVRENLLIHSLLYGVGKAQRNRRVDEVLDFTGLRERADDRVRQFSGGMKRRLMIGRAVMHRPRMIFLDEPTAGLDPGVRRKVWSLIKTAQVDGATLFLTTHYIEEAEFLCDRVAFIDKGRILAVDSPANFKSSLGKWAVDVFSKGDINSRFFDSREEADRFAPEQSDPVNIRRVNLEDVFLTMTGHGICASGGAAGGALESGANHGANHGSH